MGFAVLVAACFPTTSRPAFTVMPDATSREIELPMDRATTALALALDGDSIPVLRTMAKDGWLETGWFSVSTMQPTTDRPLGPDVVKVRAFVGPARPNYSSVVVETVYRPIADPSESPRELEEQVPADHPVALRVKATLQKMVDQYGGIPLEVIGPPHAVRDTTDTNGGISGRKARQRLLDSLGKPDTTAVPLPLPPPDTMAKPRKPAQR
jgi:hypothetical protein